MEVFIPVKYVYKIERTQIKNLKFRIRSLETVECRNTKVMLLLERLTFGGKNHSRPIKAGKVTEGEPMSYLRKVVAKRITPYWLILELFSQKSQNLALFNLTSVQFWCYYSPNRACECVRFKYGNTMAKKAWKLVRFHLVGVLRARTLVW